MPHLVGALTRHAFCLQPLLVLIAAVMGGALAEDRRRGFTLTVLARGGSRRRYLGVKLLGAAASSALSMGLVLLAFFAVVAVHSPAERGAWELEAWTGALVPELSRDHPVLHDLLLGAMKIAACAALATTGVMAGLLVPNEYVAMAATPAFFLLASAALYDTAPALCPYTYLGLERRGGAPPSPATVFLYWTSYSAFMASACQWIFTRKKSL